MLKSNQSIRGHADNEIVRELVGRFPPASQPKDVRAATTQEAMASGIAVDICTVDRGLPPDRWVRWAVRFDTFSPRRTIHRAIGTVAVLTTAARPAVWSPG